MSAADAMAKMFSPEPDTAEIDEQLLRVNCCADWPKPCGYHQGWLDGWEARHMSYGQATND